MCNRFSADRKEQIRRMALAQFGLELPDDWHPSMNIPPTSRVPVIRMVERPVASLLKWGTLLRDGLVMNARSETFETKRSWADATAHRRCLFLANGFFEFATAGKSKVPHYFTIKNTPAFCIAGIWLTATEDQPERVVMVTTTPNRLVAPFHDRMPVLLSDDGAHQWLGSTPLPENKVKELCTPWDAELLTEHVVTSRMNSVRYQEQDCTAPNVPEADLFG